MTVKNLVETGKFFSLTMPEPEREVKGVYIGDLLSWVMGRARADEAWITIMSNINVVAVASLSDVSCVILAESVKLEPEVLETAQNKGINILSTDMSAYSAALSLSELI
ncbi:MAG: AraC family transcriptional regulator [Clostridia bacterium]|nr:AraC family transcriptional regulator [Clostridia bacterium]